ncbi:MAG TPA: DASS family sodium-coupled anion symporter [Phycisphaeraceae bacterium]
MAASPSDVESPHQHRAGTRLTAGDEPTEVRSIRAMWIGLILAPTLAAAAYLAIPPETRDAAGQLTSGLPHDGRIVAALGLFMAVLWVTEALPLPVTALLPVTFLPVLTGGRISIAQAALPYADPLIFLFMGGFMIALAMERWGLHRRIALRLVLLVGTRPTVMVIGFMIATAFLSLWMSNTATTVMMTPIAISVIALVRQELARSAPDQLPPPNQPFPFAVCLMLGVAYAASIGGVATLIGTPPNLILAAFLDRTYGIQISLARWFMATIPLAAVFLLLAWWMLTRWLFPIRLPPLPNGREMIQRELAAQGPMSRGEKVVLAVFAAAALAWVTRPILVSLRLPSGGAPLAGVSDTTIAIGAAMVLFGFPVDPRRGLFALTWRQAAKLPWGILILFGGGLSLASAIQATGVAEAIGQSVAALAGWPRWAVVLTVLVLTKALTELASSTAITAALLPVMAAAATGLGIAPPALVIPMTIAVSWSFMLPVATPPNAIAIATGHVTPAQMARAGFWLGLVGIALAMLLAMCVEPWLGLEM